MSKSEETAGRLDAEEIAIRVTFGCLVVTFLFYVVGFSMGPPLNWVFPGAFFVALLITIFALLVMIGIGVFKR